MNNTVELSRRMHGVLCVMDEELRLRIKEQRFYLVQSKARLLPPFANIVAEADALEMEYVETIPDYYDPENSDMSEVYDAAFHHGLEHYDLLQDMKSRTILSIVAGMYHHFDKCIRTMLARELRQGGWVIGKNTRDIIWKCSWRQLESLMRSFGWDMAKAPGYNQLEAMRLVVNVFKHGEGVAFQDLKNQFPQFIPAMAKDASPWSYVDHTDMAIEEHHLEPFSDAIIGFWEALPGQLSIAPDVKTLVVPQFFGDALRADLKTSQ